MKTSTKLVLKTLTGLVMLASGVSLAFKPDKHSFGHTMITESVLSEGGYSYGTGNQVAGWSTLVAGEKQAFTHAALENVVLGVQATDFMKGQLYSKDGVRGWVYGELWTEEAHCDNDLTEACSKRIVRIRNEDVVNSLAEYIKTKDKFHVVNARIMLGRALHTLQDFYAHSSYSDTHTGSAIYAALTTNPVAVGLALPGAEVATCLARGEPFNSTWADNGGNYAFTANGADAAVITSGYFFNSYSAAGFGSAPDSEASRCDHGMEILRGTVSGINKDAPYSPFAPSPYFDPHAEIADAAAVASPLHLRASYHAAAHTSRFLDEVVSAIRASTTDVAVQDEMVTALLGIEQVPVIGFVIDNTGSMSDIISGVRTSIERTIDQAETTRPDTRFLVLSYGDPYVGTPTIGTAQQARAAVAGIGAGGGGDCPELTNTGLLAALEAAPEKSKLLVFTDASSKDGARQPEVEKLALDKQIVVSYSVSGSCSPIDPTYYKTAAATGGQVLVTAHDSASVASAFLGISIEAAGFAPRPTVIERGTVNGVRSVDIPVNADATGFSVMATFDSGSLALYDPAGTRIAAGAPGVETNTFIGGQGYAVRTPAPGVWRAELTTPAAVSYTINAGVTSALDVKAVKFFTVDGIGRAGHESSMPYLNGPPPGKVRLDVALSGGEGVAASRFELIGEDGAAIASAAMSNLGRGHYSGTVTIPAGAFRLRVTGTDSAGRTFVRVAPALVTPIRFSLELPEYPTWVPGHANSLRVLLTNHGAPATFQIGATLRDVPASVSAPTPTLAEGASATADIAVRIPAGSAGREELAVSVTVDGVTEIIRLPLPVDADSDGDGVSDREESGRSGGSPDHDGNADGQPDRLQPNVISLYSRQRAAYLTAAIEGPGSFADAAPGPAPAFAPAGTPSFPLELVGYRIVGLAPGASARVSMRMPKYLTVADFKLYAASASGEGGQVTDFAANGTTGAAVSGNVVTLTYVDGQRGDADGAANGVVSTLGGPTRVDIRGADHVRGGTPKPPAEPQGGGGGGGGCTIGGTGKDGSLPILAIVAAVLAWRRRGKAS
ncbi:MAG: choice-of-anchor U domain-containing protein [Pseudomonadota bacterium]